MGLKEAWHGLIGKSEKNELLTTEKEAIIQQIAEANLFPIVKIPETNLDKYKKIPISGLAALGAAFSKIPDTARTITQTKSTSVALKETLFTAINPKGVSGFLKANEYGTDGNIIQVNEQGKQVIAGRMRFKPIDNLPLNETYSMTIPFDPTLMVVAVAVMAIEQKLDKIQESIESILQFLELDKQATQRGNLKKLAEIAEDYKMYCEDKTFCVNRNITVQSIQTQSLADIEFYREKISSHLKKQKSIHLSSNSDSLMYNVIREFAEYQLSCYLYSYCAFMDTMLRTDFSSKNLNQCKNRMLALAKEYDALYSDCYSQIKKYQRNSIDSRIVDGVGTAIKGLGKAVGTIPIIKDKKFEESLIEVGKKIDDKNACVIDRKLEIIEEFQDNRTSYFIDNLSSIDLMYNGENALLTDGENVYVLQTQK